MSASKVLVLATTLAAAAVAAVADTTVLRGATVHPVSGPVLPNATVVITDGKIAAVGADLVPPAGSKTVDLAGKHLYPGYVSPDTLLGLTEIAAVGATNDYAETGDTNPNIRAEVGWNPDSELLPVARVNGITSAHVVPRGGAIAGTSAVVHLDGWTYEDMTVKAPIGLHVRWPDMTPQRGGFNPPSDEDQKKTRDHAIEAIRRAFEDGRTYLTARTAFGQAGIPRQDQDVKWDAMTKALRGEIPVFFHVQTLAQIRAALRFADEQKLAKLILVGAADAWRIASELRARDVAVITKAPPDLPLRRDSAYDESFALAARLQEAGVRFCIGDSGGTDAAENARNLPYLAAQAAGFGLTRDQALRAITLSSAEILGVADRVGSIEAGKSADLIVTDGDPLELGTRVEQVYIAGKAISMESRHTRLFKKYDQKPRGEKARPR